MRLFEVILLGALSLGSARSRLDSFTAKQAAAPVAPARQTTGNVLVLQHRADAFDRAPKWSLAPTPVTTAGGADAAEFDLTRVWQVELLSDGRLVTLAPIGSRLLVFAPDGRGEKSLGRQGQGPGELMAPAGMSRISSDTLVIFDNANNRINWILATKGFVATKPMPSIPQLSIGRPVGALRSGALVMCCSGLLQPGQEDSVTRPPTSVIVLSPAADRVTVVATIPDLEVVRVTTRFRGRPRSTTTMVRFSRRASAVAWDTVIATGSGDGYTIDLRAADGAIRSTLRVPVRRRVVTKAIRDSDVARALRQFDGPQAERMVDPAESRRLEQTKPSADSLPPYGDWFVTRNRTLWVVDAAAPDDAGGAATAFRQDGAILGRLTWSGRSTPVAFTDDRVVMRDTDSDGVVTLRVFRIETGAR